MVLCLSKTHIGGDPFRPLARLQNEVLVHKRKMRENEFGLDIHSIGRGRRRPCFLFRLHDSWVLSFQLFQWLVGHVSHSRFDIQSLWWMLLIGLWTNVERLNVMRFYAKFDFGYLFCTKSYSFLSYQLLTLTIQNQQNVRNYWFSVYSF